MLKRIALTFLILTFTVGTVFAVPLPWLDYGGIVQLENGVVVGSNVDVGSVGYVDNSVGWTDSILGSAVVVSNFYGVALGTYSADGATFSLISNHNIVFSADLIDIALVSIGGDYVINSSYSANLQNVWVDSNFDSRWLREISAAAVSADNQAATRITLTFVDLETLVDTGNGLVNVQGKIAPVPEPATLLLLGSGLVGLAFLKRRKS